jgi:hypothetical protein
MNFYLKNFVNDVLGQYFTFFPHIEGLVIQCRKVLTVLNFVSIVSVAGCYIHCNELQHFINVQLLLINLKNSNFSKSLFCWFECLPIHHI